MDIITDEPVVPEGWSIDHKPKPKYPNGEYDYNFEHDDYNGCGLLSDKERQWGYGSSIADCIAQINVIIDEGME